MIDKIELHFFMRGWTFCDLNCGELSLPVQIVKPWHWKDLGYLEQEKYAVCETCETNFAEHRKVVLEEADHLLCPCPFPLARVVEWQTR